MLSSLAAVDLTFDDDEWQTPRVSAPPLNRTASVNSWGVTSFGRGFDWTECDGDSKAESSGNRTESISPYSNNLTRPSESKTDNDKARSHKSSHPHMAISSNLHHSQSLHINMTPPTVQVKTSPSILSMEPLAIVASPSHSRAASPQVFSRPLSVASTRQPPPPSTPSSPRPRRRSSQQRVSLIAGRVLIAPIEPPSPPPILPHSLLRTPSSISLLSNAASTRAPSPSSDVGASSGGRSIADYLIECEIGRGAYGLVKRARERMPDGTLGPPLVLKQVIKSRILADCWKRHPKHGTIPIEIYVLSALSNASYILPPRRPWDPARFDADAPPVDEQWVEGKVVKGHPNICPMHEFFEDNHYYYLVMPSTTADQLPNEPPPPSDLFDLVETFPQGLPPSSIRTYLGQIADALCFLHSQGIVHRDVKDENVVLGVRGKCILIDFGSSGLVRKNGWDTFSGTLDYAGPEILRGERYYGKEQDVWAFGVVAYVLLVGECPFMTAAEALEGLESPFANPSISLDERCAEEKEGEGEEADGGGALGDAAALVRACLQLDPSARPSFETILQSRFLAGNGGWGEESGMRSAGGTGLGRVTVRPEGSHVDIISHQINAHR